MDLSPEVLQAILGKFIILLLSVAVHEFGHAWIADRLGDRLPRQQGRVTLNPLAHADPIGTVALPLFSLVAMQGASMGIGWGKPVETLPNAYTRKFRMRVAHMFVSFAGPAMNILFGTLIALVLYALLVGGVFQLADFAEPNALPAMMVTAVWTNYVLAFFNLIPAKPLDGGSVLDGLVSDRIRRSNGYEQYMKYSLFVAIAFMVIPTLRAFFIWPATQLLKLVMGAIGLAYY